MSRSRWALTKGCTPVSAMMFGVGKRARLEASVCLGSLLGTALSITRLLAVTASAATLTLAPAPAPARAERSIVAELPSTQHSQISQTRKAPAGRDRHRRPTTADPGAANEVQTINGVLAFGSGYGQPNGSPAVRGLQRRLAVAGFGPGPIDGLYGPRTEAAVARFQAATGLPVDGVAGPHTLAAVYSPTPTIHPGAGYGSGGSRLVRRLQRLLARAGYDPRGIDGRYGSHTRQAVRRFQAQHGLRVDGIANPRTFIALLRQTPARHRRGPAASRRTARPATRHSTAHPRTVPTRSHPTATRKAAPAPTTVRRTRQPSGPPFLVWLGLIGAGIAAALLLTAAAYTRRRPDQPGQPGPAPRPRDHGDETPRAERAGRAALSAVRNGKERETLARAPESRSDADAAFRLGILLEEQNDPAGAEAAYRHADHQGHAAAASNLGVLLERRGDREGAEAAYRRASHRGDPNGAFNLAVLLEERHDATGAEQAYRNADDRGHAAAASNLGVLLERRGDRQAAQAAYRRADERGDANGAFNLGVLLEEQNDLAAAAAAYRRADQRGSAEVANAARAALMSLRANPGAAQVRNGGDFDVE